MQKYGYSQSEMDTILNLEHARIAANKSQKSARYFPSNPQIGDIYKADPIEIHFDTVVTSAAGLAGLMVGNGIGAGVAIVLANAMWTEYQHHLDATGVAVTVYYTYGYTNDGVLGWTPGKTEWGFVYN